MKEVEKVFSNQLEKVLVMPDYKCKHHHVEKVISKKSEKDYAVPDCINVYLIKNTVSDLTDEDFTKAAQEYKQKQQAKTIPVEREREHLKAAYSLFSVC